MFGNLLRECGVLERLSNSAQNELVNIVTILLGITISTKMTADGFLQLQTLLIIAFGLVAFVFDTIGGVLFLASYPSNGSDFAGSTIPMLSLYGEKDGLTSLENIEDTKHLLSDAAQVYEIKGGNHAQFGLYGEQSGDQPASITAKEQQDEMIEVTIQWLNGLDEE